jgi:hypothetical protein
MKDKLKYNLSYKDDEGMGFGAESVMIEDGGPERVYRVFEINSHSIESGESILILEDQLSPLIKILMCIERLTEEVR